MLYGNELGSSKPAELEQPSDSIRSVSVKTWESEKKKKKLLETLQSKLSAHQTDLETLRHQNDHLKELLKKVNTEKHQIQKQLKKALDAKEEPGICVLN